MGTVSLYTITDYIDPHVPDLGHDNSTWWRDKWLDDFEWPEISWIECVAVPSEKGFASKQTFLLIDSLEKTFKRIYGGYNAVRFNNINCDLLDVNFVKKGKSISDPEQIYLHDDFFTGDFLWYEKKSKYYNDITEDLGIILLSVLGSDSECVNWSIIPAFCVMQICADHIHSGKKNQYRLKRKRHRCCMAAPGKNRILDSTLTTDRSEQRENAA